MTQIIKTNYGSRKKNNLPSLLTSFILEVEKKIAIIAYFFYLKKFHINANTFKASHGILKITNTVLDAFIFSWREAECY